MILATSLVFFLSTLLLSSFSLPGSITSATLKLSHPEDNIIIYECCFLANSLLIYLTSQSASPFYLSNIYSLVSCFRFNQYTSSPLTKYPSLNCVCDHFTLEDNKAFLFFIKRVMGCNQGLIFGLRLHHLTVSLLFVLISSSSQLRFHADGRKLIKTAYPSQAVMDEKRAILRGQIGSRPPRCDGRCSSCGHCEAIQVPTNPQIKSGGSRNSTAFSSAAYARGEDNSNYKPMSWKCKCGNLIFNP